MSLSTFNCQQANQIDLVDYLSTLGHHPKRINGDDYWYLSPLREEKTPSFKVKKTSNIWYDHGMGKGGNLVDFCVIYHHCSISDLLVLLYRFQGNSAFSFQQPAPSKLMGAGEKEGSPGKIVVLNTRPLVAPSLIDYLEKRGISLDIAERSCREVEFSLYGKHQTAIGFANRSGGYELRSEHFRGSSSPKDISFFDNRQEEIAVFEGFFDYLSFQAINKHIQAPMTNCLVLNSLAFLEKSRPLMEQYSRIYLLLDRDVAGMTFTGNALKWNPDKYIDRSEFYRERKDLNEWLIHNHMQVPRQNQGLRRGRSI
jgi:DNA primase